MIEELEKEIFDQVGQTEFIWTVVSRKLIEIRADELFTAKVDEQSGRPFKSWDAYLRYISRRMRKQFASGSVSTIKAWVTKFEVYDEQLGFTDEWLMEMGSHANILLKVANISVRGRRLEKEDRLLPNGGVKLGALSFKKVCDDIHERIVQSTGPEDEWTIGETKAKVNEYLGSEPPITKEWDVKVGEKNLVQVESLKYIVGDMVYEFGRSRDLILLDDFLKIAKGPNHRVSGLPSVL